EYWYGDFSAMPVYEDPHDQTCQIMAVVVVQDITERVRADAQLRWLKMENIRLRRFAAKATEGRDDFISVAGNELRTPVVGLRLYTKLLADSVTSPDNFRAASLRDAIRAVDEESTKLLQLVNRILDIANLGDSQFTLRRRKIDLAHLTRGVTTAV